MEKDLVTLNLSDLTQYAKTLAEAEGWDEDTRVELLDGEVVWMSPINDPHAGCVNRLNRLFSRRYTDDVALVSVQNPIRIDSYDEPQPDVALLRPRADDYATATPTPTDTLLLVEVSDSTLRIDLGRKLDPALGSTLVFFLPCFVLAILSPYMIRLATRSVDRVGTIAGLIYSASTVGSMST